MPPLDYGWWSAVKTAAVALLGALLWSSLAAVALVALGLW
jgi:hypothetical protein